MYFTCFFCIYSIDHSSLSQYILISYYSIGRNITHLIDRQDEPHCFRLHKDRVYYVRLVLKYCPFIFDRIYDLFELPNSEDIMKRATSVNPHLISLGVCFGKFTKTGKFRLHITALEYISQYAKVCLSFLHNISSLVTDHIFLV